ncbi:HAD-IIB family hydrolase [Undibacterium sp. TS12]|uniref:HAD family hydrolase n=1 Tax=Undibacterium sp. TS12 TaxID=2908202 RepID=UPI001F4CC987|nr:HAD-IIB family hydrolase [Undibacterium sp. TS12]MCH8619935.1 HAD-IIB family hydrolase [Undibacterium sp. TS12]
MSMQPLGNWPAAQRRQVRGILTDIDDTFSSHGKLTVASLAALDRAKAAGLRRIAVTGRPTYWTLPLLRLCDFDAVIAENGASAFWIDGKGAQQALYYADAEVRKQHRQQLLDFADIMRRHFPDILPAADAAQRIGDLAFDIAENIPALPMSQVNEAVVLIREHGLHATTSSIHAHASVLPFSKQSMSERVLHEVFGISDEEACSTYVFIGDSANDASMFAHYPLSVGVANVRKFLDRFDAHPVYVCEAEYGAGFVELVDFLLKAKDE